MRSTHARLSCLEEKAAAIGHGDKVIDADWANDPYYLALPLEEQIKFEAAIEKLRPLILTDVRKAFDTLTLEELEVVEGFYVAYFERTDPEWLAQVRNGTRSLDLEARP